MAAAKWQLLQTLFDDALSLPPHARKGFLDTACGDDPGLRSVVDSLLAADAADQADIFGIPKVYVTRKPGCD